MLLQKDGETGFKHADYLLSTEFVFTIRVGMGGHRCGQIESHDTEHFITLSVWISLGITAYSQRQSTKSHELDRNVSREAPTASAVGLF